MSSPVVSGARSRHRFLKIAGVLAGLVLVLGVVLLVMLPRILSGILPGYVGSAASGTMAGSVRVEGMSLSWGGPQEIGPVVVTDPQGAEVANVKVKATAGLLGLIRGNRDLGTLSVGGRVAIVRTSDGQTNLEKSTQAKPGVKVQTNSSSGPIPAGVKAALEVTGLDVTYKELDAGGAVARQASVLGLKGTASVDTGVAGGAAQAELAAAVSDGAGAPSALSLSTAVTGFIGADGLPAPQGAKGKLAIKADRLPVGLIDALAKQNGRLVSAVGESLSVDVRGESAGAAGELNALLSGANVNVDVGLSLKGQRIAAARPGSVKIASTKFVEQWPEVRDALARAGVSLQQWPAVELVVESLNVPSEAKAAGELDLRGSGLSVTVKTTGVNGTLTPVGEGAQGRAVALAPAEVRIAATDLAQGVRLTAQSAATLDGQPAGRLSADVQADGLLDESGRLVVLRGGQPRGLKGQIEASAISAEVLQPIVSAAKVPMRVSEDVGPSVDVSALLVQAGEGVDVDARVKSARVEATAPVRWAGGVLSARQPIRANLNGSVGLANRLLSAGGAAPVTLSGQGTVAVEVSELSVPTKGGFELGALTMKANVKVRDVSASVAAAKGQGPVLVRSLDQDLSIKPGQAIESASAARMEHEGRPFEASSKLAITGLAEAFKSGTTPVPGVGGVRINGTGELKDAPTSLAKLAPGGGNEKEGGSALVPELIRGLLGASVTSSVRFDGEAGGQGVAAELKASNLETALSAKLTPTAIAVAAVNAEATVRPDTAKSLLRAAGQTGEAVERVQMDRPARLRVQVMPMNVPISVQGSSISPRLDGIEMVQVKGELLETLIVRGIPAGGRTLSGGVSGFTLAASVPGAALSGAASARRLTVDAQGRLMLDAQRGVAEMSMKADAASDLSALDAKVTLAKLDTAAADGVMGEPGLVSGALGAEANVMIVAQRSTKNGPIAGSVQVDSPLLKTGALAVNLGEDRLSLAGPASVNWSVQPAWAEKFLLAGKDDQGRARAATVRLTGPAAVTLDLRALVVSLPRAGADGTATGPMMPGVFSLDAGAKVASLGLSNPASIAEPITLTGINGSIKSGAGGAIDVDAKIAGLTQGATQLTDPFVLKGQVKNLADARGVVNSAGATLNMDLSGEKLPVALLDSLGGLDGQAGRTLGREMNLSVKAVDASRQGGRVDVRINSRGLPAVGAEAAPGGKAPAQGAPPAPAKGAAPAKGGPVESELAALSLGGPIKGGVLDLGAPGAAPLNVKLTQFKYDVNTALLKMFPLFASAEKLPYAGPAPTPPGQGPSIIASKNLRVPVDGDMAKLNGEVDVDIGVVQYKFKEILGDFLDATLLTGAANEQKPIQAFTVRIVNGVASYDKFEIPVRNFVLKNRGTIDLVNRQIDVITYIPTVAASKGLLGKVNKGLGEGFGKALPDVLSDGTMIPLRVRGPLDNPRYEVDLKMFFDEFGKGLINQPAKIIGDVIDLFGPKKK
jgi:hypothetical protein